MLRYLLSIILSLALYGMGTPAHAGAEVPPEHGEAVAACNIENVELCGWWQNDPRSCCDLLVYGTRWVLLNGYGTAECWVVEEGRRGNEVYSIFECEWSYDEGRKTGQKSLEMLALDDLAKAEFHVARQFISSDRQSDDKSLACLRLGTRELVFNRVHGCGLSWERYSRRVELTPSR